MTAIDATDPRRFLDLAMKGDKGDCMAAIQFLELQLRILANGIEGLVDLKPAEWRALRKLGNALGYLVNDWWGASALPQAGAA